MSEKAIKNSNAVMPTWARIILFFVSFIIVSGIFQVVGLFAAGMSVLDMDELRNMSTEKLLITQFFGFLGLLLNVFIFRKFIDRQSIMSLGFSFSKRCRDLLAGFSLAAVIMGVGFITLNALGYIKVVDFLFVAKSIFLGFILFIIVSLNEEIMVRGYILNNLLTTMNKFWALLLSSSIFALLHVFNSGLSTIGIINLLLAGILLGSTYIYTKNLWFPISLHLFWNFIQGPVLGYKVSGMNLSSMISIETVGDNIYTGGKFGFEGSIVCTILMVISIVAIIYYYERKERMQPAV